MEIWLIKAKSRPEFSGLISVQAAPGTAGHSVLPPGVAEALGQDGSTIVQVESLAGEGMGVDDVTMSNPLHVHKSSFVH